MKTRQSGFTLVEMMVTVSIVVVIAALAVPGFHTMLLGRQIETAADTLASDFRFSRSEAVKRTNRVTICASSNGTSCTGAGAFWKEGWLVFVDEDGDGVIDAEDVIVRVQDAMPGILSIADTDGTSRPHFVFQSSGWSQSASQKFLVTPSGSSGVAARLLCISNKGRPGIRAKGETTCA
jgi:type IV fimbrial biogenesis protein FimT